MKIRSLFDEKQVVYSFEIFPPKRTSPIETVYTALERMHRLSPDYISVTYGAGGTVGGGRTVELAAFITRQYAIPSIAHLTCVHSDREELTAILEAIQAKGLENILALRGDRVPGLEKAGEFAHANELMAFIRTRGDFCLGGACYPEGHFECQTPEEDVLNLHKKVEAGVDFLTSQLFFDNAEFYRFLGRCDQAGVGVPISAGIMPLTSKSQVEKMVTLSGSTIPGRLSRLLSRYENDPESLRKAGIDYAVEQILDLVEHGVRGIHLYTMNGPATAEAITAAVRPAIDAKNEKRA